MRLQYFSARTAFLSLLTVVFVVSTSPAQFAKGYDVISYNATVRLDRQNDFLSGEVAMTARADMNLARILQHAKFISVDSVFVNGRRAALVPVDSADGSYYCLPNDPLSLETFTVHSYFHGPGKQEQYPNHWGGVDDEDSMMFAMGVGFMAPYVGCTRHWLPCYDLPDDKPDSVDLSFICASGDVTASNGLLTSNTVQGGLRTMHWHVSHPIATYLLTFATGPYTIQEIQNGLDIPFQVFARPRDSSASAVQMNARVRLALVYFDSLFARYPHEKVGYVITPIGSMEHQTMICLAKQVLDTNRTDAVHELAHQWWGDWVTCKTFDDAWLNEGFARYSESLFHERFASKQSYFQDQAANARSVYAIKSKKLYIDTLPLHGAPTADHHTNNYPGTIYSKGAAVLGMLREYLGDSLFFESLRTYGHSHAYSTAESSDLQTAFEHVSGQQWGWFFHEFVYNRGAPVITVRWNKTATGAALECTQLQDTLGMRFFGMPLLIRNGNGPQATTRFVWMDSTKTSTALVDFGAPADSIVINPHGDLLLRVSAITQTSASGVPRYAALEGSLSISPNPVRGARARFHVRFPIAAHTCQIAIHDTMGKSVFHSTFQLNGTEAIQEVDLSGLPAGTYFASIETESGSYATNHFTLD